MARKRDRRKSSWVRIAAKLSEELLWEALRLVPRSMRVDTGRCIERALRLWVEDRKEHLVDLDIRRMGRDPRILAECRKINEEFSVCAADGLAGI